jgi:hypothetical protein
MCRCHGQTQITKEGEPMPRPILPRPIEIPIGPSIAYVPLTRGQFALIDRDDVERVGKFNWCADFSENTHTFYVRTHAEIDGRKSTRLHRFLSVESYLSIDHANGNSLDNRKSNLRTANHNQQMQNRHVLKTSKSGIKGAYWFPRDKRFYSYIVHDGNKTWLGSFLTAEEAGTAYAQAAKRIHKEFASIRGRVGVLFKM